MSPELKPGIYEHSKSGKRYEVIGIALHSETQEPLVIYKALYDSPDFGPGALWARPLVMFTENVMVEGKLVPRFQFIK